MEIHVYTERQRWDGVTKKFTEPYREHYSRKEEEMPLETLCLWIVDELHLYSHIKVQMEQAEYTFYKVMWQKTEHDNRVSQTLNILRKLRELADM